MSSDCSIPLGEGDWEKRLADTGALRKRRPIAGGASECVPSRPRTQLVRCIDGGEQGGSSVPTPYSFSHLVISLLFLFVHKRILVTDFVIPRHSLGRRKSFYSRKSSRQTKYLISPNELHHSPTD